jgi:TRAP-type C4-dicarboxylate transport system permease small subunit
MTKTIQPVINGIFKLFEIVMVICIALMLVMVFGNVILRIFFNTGIDLSEELPRFAFVWMTFIGAIVGMRKHAHLGVDVITQLLPLAGKKVCWGISQFIMAVCCIYIVYGTWLQHEILEGNSSPVAQISMIWVFGISYVSGTFIGIMCLFNLYRLLTGQVEESELSDVMEEGMAEIEVLHAPSAQKQ